MRIPPLAAAIAGFALVAALALWGSPARDPLTESTWHWTEIAAPGDATPSAIPDPARYTLDLGPERRFAAIADCAVVTGTYGRQPPGRMGPLSVLRISPDPGAPVTCGPGSLAAEYVEALGRAATFRVQDGALTISLSNGGSMTFR